MGLARPGLPAFRYVRATSFPQVHQLLQDGNVKLLMGGTDLFTQMRDGAWRPETVLDVKSLPGMQQISLDDSGLTVGAAVTMNQLVRHPGLPKDYRLLVQAAHSVASYQLRNRATLGGNLCNASPCADTAPAVLALDATMHLSSAAGERTLPAADFLVGPGRTALRPDEMLIALHFPIPPAGCVGSYVKLGRNKLGDLSVVGVAALGYPDAAVPSGCRFRVVLGSVAPVPLRVTAAEATLAAEPLNDATLEAAAEQAMQAAAPISDVRAGASYQTRMVRTLTLRALKALWAELQGVN